MCNGVSVMNELPCGIAIQARAGPHAWHVLDGINYAISGVTPAQGRSMLTVPPNHAIMRSRSLFSPAHMLSQINTKPRRMTIS